MLKQIRYGVLKIREIYYRKKWLYYANKQRICERNKNYKEMYEWKDKASIFDGRRKYVIERLLRLDL